MKKYAFLAALSFRDLENRIARQKMIQIGGGDVSGRPKYEILHIACFMCRFMHVLCADLCMCYVHCSPNGLAALRRARVARFASVQVRTHIYIYIYIYIYRDLMAYALPPTLNWGSASTVSILKAAWCAWPLWFGS